MRNMAKASGAKMSTNKYDYMSTYADSQPTKWIDSGPVADG